MLIQITLFFKIKKNYLLINASEYLQEIFFWGIWGPSYNKISNFIEKKIINMLDSIKFQKQGCSYVEYRFFFNVKF
jgi:hypothetical protein